MTPFTEVLEQMAVRLPEVGGVCINAESELEAIGMAWGAAATGARAATGSVGQGLSLMQESISEMTTAGVPLVILNMARGQSDYYQATRGGGHGDYRTLVVAPMDIPEAVSLVTHAFDMAERWRNPVMVMGDYYLAHVYQSVEIPEPAPRTARPQWALDGRSGGTGKAKLVSSLGDSKQRDDVGYDLEDYYQRRAQKSAQMLSEQQPLYESGFCEDASVVVVAYGTPSRYIRAAVTALRQEGFPAGFIRPISLVPFPTKAIADIAQQAKVVCVYENSTGQMIDDVRLSVLGQAPVSFIGGLTTDTSGFGIGADLDVGVLRRRIDLAAREYGAWM
jgi:2-oxoglutarate ferredoxin oxidoreductase subunit alpha